MFSLLFFTTPRVRFNSLEKGLVKKTLQVPKKPKLNKCVKKQEKCKCVQNVSFPLSVCRKSTDDQDN